MDSVTSINWKERCSKSGMAIGSILSKFPLGSQMAMALDGGTTTLDFHYELIGFNCSTVDVLYIGRNTRFVGKSLSSGGDL